MAWLTGLVAIIAMMLGLAIADEVLGTVYLGVVVALYFIVSAFQVRRYKG